MKVKTLISYLQDMNPDADVGVKTIDDVYVNDLYVSYICKDLDGNSISSKETLQVWIEASDLCTNCQFYDDGFCIVYEKDACDVEECYQFLEE